MIAMGMGSAWAQSVTINDNGTGNVNVVDQIGASNVGTAATITQGASSIGSNNMLSPDVTITQAGSGRLNADVTQNGGAAAGPNTVRSPRSMTARPLPGAPQP